jgi:hypothetical protein
MKCVAWRASVERMTAATEVLLVSDEPPEYAETPVPSRALESAMNNLSHRSRYEGMTIL